MVQRIFYVIALIKKWKNRTVVIKWRTIKVGSHILYVYLANRIFKSKVKYVKEQTLWGFSTFHRLSQHSSLSSFVISLLLTGIVRFRFLNIIHRCFSLFDCVNYFVKPDRIVAL